MLGALSIALPTSIFALKFLEWWYASDFAKQLSRKAAESLNLPPPVVTGLEDAKPSGKHAPGSRAKAAEREDEHEAGPTAEMPPSPRPRCFRSSQFPLPRTRSFARYVRQTSPRPLRAKPGSCTAYSCIHKWIAGIHPMQEEFMADKAGRWESGAGRCAVTGRRVLGGTEGLRRIMV